MRILVYGETVEWLKQVREIAEILNSEVYGVIPSRELVNQASKILDKAYVFDGLTYEPNTYHKIIRGVSDKVKPDVALFPSTIKGRTLAGLYAGEKGQPIITDVLNLRYIAGGLEIERLVYGGSCIATIRSTLPATICISIGAFKPSEKQVNGEIEYLEEIRESAVQTEFRSREYVGVPLERAEIVVAAGRGFKKKEDLEIVKELSRILNGAWSVTRPLAADYGWSDTWIGISGATINPKIYLAVGVSGQPLHMIAVRNSKTIIAINKDRSAPIFNEADYGVIGDLYQVLPKLLEKLKKKLG
ncbi:MAG: electron transfer flavoprotein subunit alpha/FixB family protein [Nitrososphaerota archaeon]